MKEGIRFMKTYKEWEGNLDDYLKIGDLVDEEMVDYFLNVLPPACWNSKVIQMGEAQNHVNGRPTFATLVRSSEGWRYAGHCFSGQSENIA